MGTNATPLADAPTKTVRESMSRNGDSWGRYLAKWALGIVAMLVTAAIIGGANASLSAMRDIDSLIMNVEHFREDVERNFARDSTAIDKIQATIDTLQIPPPSFEAKVDRIDANLAEHMRQTVGQAHIVPDTLIAGGRGP